jgi:hypothetical protein
MGKARTALKFKEKEKVITPDFVITGGVISGYTILNRNNDSVYFSYLMWDAIDEKKRLQEGGEPLDPEDVGRLALERLEEVESGTRKAR